MSASKEKKEKKDKKESKSADSGTAAAASDGGSKSKEKKSSSAAKDDGGDGGSKSKEVRVVGASTYLRQKLKGGKDGGKTVVVWCLKGKTLADKAYCWKEKTDNGGAVYFSNLADDSTTWNLPDVASGPSGSGSASAASAGAESDGAVGAGLLEKKKFKEKKEWKEDATKKPVLAACKKALQNIAEIKSEEVSKDEYNILSSNISKEFMSLFRKLDAEGEAWINEQAVKQVSDFLSAKKSAMAARTAATDARTSLSGPLLKESEMPLPQAPMANKVFPVSPFMSKAYFLRDPYYSRRIYVANPRRTALESNLEDVTFLQPGGGTVRVLCAVPVKAGPNADKNIVVAVVRDWTGAFCMMLVDPPNDMGESVVNGAYPLLSYVDFPTGSYAKVPVVLDDMPFIFSFRDQENATYLRDSLFLAFCSMYGQGSDDERILTMRSYAVEFSSQETNYYPNGTIPDSTALLRTVLGETSRDPQSLENDFQQLRLCMRTPEGRDTVLRTWIRSVDEGQVFKKRSLAMMSNLLRIVDDAILLPAFHEDSTIATNVIARLTMLKTDQPDDVRNRIEQLKTSYRVVTATMEKWRSRVEMPDKPFELCFTPVRGSTGALHDEMNLAQRRLSYARSQVPPGIYLTMLCYCGHSVLCDALGNLFSEVIIPNPTEDELAALTADSEEFRWVLGIGGGTENWSNDVSAWAEVYDNAGRNTFRSKFLHAARRLLESYTFTTLGIIFDVPVVLKTVSCGHIVCISRIASRDVVPQAIGEWRNMSDFETQLYLQACVSTHSTRLQFLPTTYHNCLRFVKAAVDYREMVDKRLPQGFYVALFVVVSSSSGRMILLPEENRLLPPMVHVWEELPSLEQWRWMQSLNERKRRTRSFGLDSQGVPVTFEQRFAKAIVDLETAVGLPVEQFYDNEMFCMDETGQTRCLFAVVRWTAGIKSTPSGALTFTAPTGAISCVWKHIDAYEHAYFKILWPRVFLPLFDERSAHYRRAFATCQPFAVDEVCRLQHDSALACYCDVDKYALLVSWPRILSNWLFRDGRTLVEAYGGEEDESVARSVEEAVEIAVSNFSTSQDINVQTMKSLIVDAGSSLHFSWATFLSKMREIDRVVSLGYAQRLDPGSNAELSKPPTKFRTYDELSDADSDDERVRAPTVYEVPCTLEELILKDIPAAKSEKHFIMQDIVQDVVDLACIDAVDVGNVEEMGKIVSDMISVIEATEDLLDKATLVSMKQATEETAWADRTKFQQQWLDVFQSDADLQEHANRRPNEQPSALGSPAGGATRQREALLQEDDLDAPLMPPVFYDGSTRVITSVQDGIRYCMAQAMGTSHKLLQLVKVCNSTTEALDLTQCIQDYAVHLSKRSSLIRRDGSGATGATPAGPDAASWRETRPTDEVSVVVVSKEFVEMPIHVVDPLRCLVLHGVTGKVRFPTIPTDTMQILVDHLNVNDFNVPQSLAALDRERGQAERLLETALQMKAPLLALRLASILFGTKQGTTLFFTAAAAAQVKTLFQESFLFEYGIKDWLHLEVLGGDAVSAAMDVLWWIRFAKEATADNATDRRDAFADHEGAWKQVYAETRVRVFLSFGVHAISKDEVTLWAHALGRFVEYLSLRDTAAGDPEIEVLTSTCPNLKSLDLSNTSITPHGVDLLIQNCSSLMECSVAGCDIRVDVQDALRRHCTESRRRAAT